MLLCHFRMAELKPLIFSSGCSCNDYGTAVNVYHSSSLISWLKVQIHRYGNFSSFLSLVVYSDMHRDQEEIFLQLNHDSTLWPTEFYCLKILKAMVMA